MNSTTDLTALQANARDLEQELRWFGKVLDASFQRAFPAQNAATAAPAAAPAPAPDLTPPDLSDSTSHYAGFIAHYQLTFEERCTLLLALTPHLRPRLLDVFYLKNQHFDRKFTEFGGLYGGPDGDFIPTGETLIFLLAGDDLAARFELYRLFEPEHFFARHHILRLAPVGDEAPIKAALRLSDEMLCYFTAGQARRPDFGANFPARLIETALDWDDLVLQAGTRRQIEEIKTWVEHGQTLLREWGMAKKIRPGYRSLFYGPPGTGKTMTACLLGKATGHDVYKIDLSMVVSKYIGETEKNLAKIFDQAQNRGWILFFDEADALFGKRSETRDAHDRHANQEVSFLLQRIESFDGIAILASNLRDNLDSAFARRFESIIYFPIPRAEERLLLWQQGFSKQATLDPALDLEKIAREHTLAGGAIMNVIRFASLEAIRRGQRVIAQDDVVQGIRREYAKEGKGT
jgi:AAA+ superfamily predicted ATPase